MYLANPSVEASRVNAVSSRLDESRIMPESTSCNIDFYNDECHSSSHARSGTQDPAIISTPPWTGSHLGPIHVHPINIRGRILSHAVFVLPAPLFQRQDPSSRDELLEVLFSPATIPRGSLLDSSTVMPPP